jgi:radical SAM family uncharacterized protein/radical SAM-linked protein
MEKHSMHIYENFLHKVDKPSRYLGGEQNMIRKDWESQDVRMALCFPEVYEIGMSHLGMKILYKILNDKDGCLAERCFTPWMDLEGLLRESGTPLVTLENQKPLNEFELVGFSLQAELGFSNVLTMLELGRIPLLSSDREDVFPLVLAGGPVTTNPEPFADFIDAFVIGDGEELIVQIAELVKKFKTKGSNDRNELLRDLGELNGVYVPSLFEPKFDGKEYKGMFYKSDGSCKKVKRTFIEELDENNYPVHQVVPMMQAVQDRYVVEVLRGCTHGCRFCQASFIYRPVREQPKDVITRLTKEGLQASGMEEVGLVSLSTADYSDVAGMVTSVAATASEQDAAVSLPSLRADAFSVQIAASIGQLKQTGFTFAPEAGSDRLRAVINKNVSREDLFAAVNAALEQGWSTIKLYFMIGLPTETDEDIEQTIELIKDLEKRVRHHGKRNKLNVSFGIFIPKAHTPFQWEGFLELEEASRRLFYIKNKVNSRNVQFKWQDPKQSYYEAIIARGDRRVGKALLSAYQKGSRFESWTENFDFDMLMECLHEHGLTADEYLREFSTDETLFWEHIDVGVSRNYFLKEREIAHSENPKTTEDCRSRGCHGCGIPGAGKDLKLKHSPTVGESKKVRRKQTDLTKNDAIRYRLGYSKIGACRFLSQSDLIRQFQIGLRIAGWPALFTKGFHPRPVMQFGPVLSQGMESEKEFMELWTLTPIDDDMHQAMNKALPEGVDIVSIERIEKMGGESLNQLYPRADFEIHGMDMELAKKGFETWSTSDSLMVLNRKKEIDLKKAVEYMELDGDLLKLRVSMNSPHGHNANPYVVLLHLFETERNETGALRIIKTSSLGPA